MSNSVPKVARLHLLLGAALSVSSCAGMGMGSVADILVGNGGIYGSQREVSGEVRGVDTRRQEIEVRSLWGGSDRVRYDSRTQVVYRQRRYSVRDLERGDVVRIRLDDRQSRPYASYIEVQQSVQDQRRGTASNRLQRFEGAIVRIDTQRGYFDLQQTRGGTVMVSLPYEPDRSVRDRFRRLRRGDRVRIEGYPLNQSRVELRRFI